MPPRSYNAYFEHILCTHCVIMSGDRQYLMFVEKSWTLYTEYKVERDLEDHYVEMEYKME